MTANGSVSGIISDDGKDIDYQIEGSVLDSGKFIGIDILAEVRAAILAEIAKEDWAEKTKS